MFSRNLGFNLGLSLERHKARTEVRVPKSKKSYMAEELFCSFGSKVSTLPCQALKQFSPG